LVRKYKRSRERLRGEYAIKVGLKESALGGQRIKVVSEDRQQGLVGKSRCRLGQKSRQSTLRSNWIARQKGVQLDDGGTQWCVERRARGKGSDDMGGRIGSLDREIQVSDAKL